MNGIVKKDIDVYKAAGKWTSHTLSYRGVQIPWNGENTVKVMLSQKAGDPFLSAISCEMDDSDSKFAQSSRKVQSGRQGFQSFKMDLKKSQGTFELYYEMFKNPDKLEILYEGQQIYSTNGLMSGSKTIDVSYGSPASTSTGITIEISAPNSGTAWNFKIACPQ